MIRLLPLLLSLAACGGNVAVPVTRDAGPPDARPGACYARGVTPAVLETVTEQVREASDDPAAPTRFRTITETRIVQPRGINWFETPCALRAGDPDFIAQVQRALIVRDLYAGPVTGDYDAATRAAVRRFQSETGPESGTLSTASAKSLGLVALGRDGV